ncbi:Olfactory receptor 9G4 [Chelonia mydas]|uniref:Olfactory receptor 9G4 n=1 Tax=Chelonia mydas TaxID=8469 RepID=M7ALI5_CHEMY|nr:Olfactory receptor 9G4 [Chelonia mydas]
MLICTNRHLHTPMDFFTGSLSFRILADLLLDYRGITLASCAAQFFFSAGLADIFLAGMAYSCYMVTCNPLHDTMSKGLCLLLVACHTFRLDFCGSDVINHFFCDVPQCWASPVTPATPTRPSSLALSVALSSSAFSLSYGYVVAAGLFIHSAKGRRKTFSAGAAQLASIALYYGSLLFM